MENKRYNGWTNYETWNIALWFDNDSWEYWQERAQELFEDASGDKSFTKAECAALDLADEMKKSVEDNTPTTTGMYADLIHASISAVNWYEIAEHFIEDVDKDESEVA